MKKRFYLLSILLSTVIACCSLSCANKGNTLTIHITDISINETFIELVEGETFTLQVEIEPDNATNKEVTWSTNDQNIAICIFISQENIENTCFQGK